jgi:branched-subunit amino acid aminotransferase/4-amino-4-deoxychorismate lyase
VRADDSAFSEGRGCYTSARIQGGRARFAERHVARLVREARELQLGSLDAALVRRALEELAQAAFGPGDGVVRLQASRDGDGRLHLIGVPRPLGPEPSEWSAIVVALTHEGGGLRAGLKVSSRLTLALAADAAREAGPATPPDAKGAVSGIARAVALERIPEIQERDVSSAELRGAREVIALNAVRGACPITRIDGAPVGDGRPGPWAARVAAALARD